MEEILSLINKLGGASFATLLALILYLGYQRTWIWGRDVSEMKTRCETDVRQLIERYEALLVREREQTEWWRGIAVRATGLSEIQAKATAALAETAKKASGS